MGKLLSGTKPGTAKMTIDREKKRRKVALILRDLEFLKKIQEMSRKEFHAEFRNILATRQATFEIIQTCLDLAFHICAHNKLHPPSTYREVFEVLRENDLIPTDLGKKMERWAGLRNVIAHRYDTIDDDLIFNLIQGELGDIERYRAISGISRTTGRD